MSCREYESSLMEWVRGGVVEAGEWRALAAHLEHCAECRSRVEEQRSLQAAIERLANERLPPDEEIEARVLAEFDRARAMRRTSGNSAARWAIVAGLAASLLLAALVNLRRTPGPLPHGRGSDRGSETALSDQTPFLAIPYSIPVAPEERVEVVRMRIPAAALLAAGYHLQVADPSIEIDAEVLVSQDGRARAIRPLTISMSD